MCHFIALTLKFNLATKSDLVLRDLDLLKTFKDVRVSFSINTLDENFRRDMDNSVSIERKIAAMKKLHEEGIRTTCFISPIFPGITDVKAIIERCKSYCNLVWLENLNLRGDYKPVILNYIKDNYPNLVDIYNPIYNKTDNSYWENLDKEIRDYCSEIGLKYIVNDDTQMSEINEPPIVVNYFYHSEITK